MELPFFQCPSGLGRAVELTLPQALQWCRLSVRLKSLVQFMHIITWETGTSTGAASPRAIHSFSRACGHIRDRTAVRIGFELGV